MIKVVPVAIVSRDSRRREFDIVARIGDEKTGSPGIIARVLYHSDMSEEQRAKIAEAIYEALKQEPVAPVARAHITMQDDGPDIDIEVLNGESLQPDMSPIDLYTKPPLGVLPNSIVTPAGELEIFDTDGVALCLLRPDGKPIMSRNRRKVW